MKSISTFIAFVLLAFIASSQADTNRIQQLLTQITKTPKPRNYQNLDQLNKTANFIKTEFQKYLDTVYFQEYKVNGITYKNVVGVVNPKAASTLVVGAHYDVCGSQEGADDNGSGIVGLLELARLFDTVTVDKRLEFVAYTLEEPPYFRTENMGSYIHAKSLFDEKRVVEGMIVLEMIGYFSDEKKSQDYPLGILKLFYGGKGDYITVVNKFGKGKFARKFLHRMKHSDGDKNPEVKSFNAPKALPGIDFSDHLNYWKFGYSASMVTDTAFYRNKNYHQSTDKMELLDLEKMAGVIDSVYKSLLAM